MKIFALFFLALTISFNAFCQKEKMNFGFTTNNYLGLNTNGILENYKKLKEVDINLLDSTDLAIYYLNKSSLNLYTTNDSALIFFNKAYSLKPKLVCNIMNIISETDRITKHSWFLKDLLDFDEDLFLNECMAKRLLRGKIKNSEVDSSVLQKTIMLRDQQERGKDGSENKINWQIQDSLDKLNRVYVDSLYETLNQNLTNLKQVDLDAFTFVLQHSVDCEWNKKWINIWLNEISNKRRGGALFGPAIKRFYTEGKYCLEKDAKGSADFINLLKTKYPTSILKVYNLD